MKDDYSDIIKLPHFTSKQHPRMPLKDRAAQFSPFAALNGHEEVLNARLEENILQEDD